MYCTTLMDLIFLHTFPVSDPVLYPFSGNQNKAFSRFPFYATGVTADGVSKKKPIDHVTSSNRRKGFIACLL